MMLKRRNRHGKWIVAAVCFFIISIANAQNIFDCQHSQRYADYLYTTQDYQRAANEYERILFSCDSLDVREALLRSYRLAGLYERAFRQLNRLFPLSNSLPAYARHEYIKLFLLTRQYNAIDSLIQRTDWLTPQEATMYALKKSMLTADWLLARQHLSRLDSSQLLNRNQYGQLINQASAFTPKKPLLAGALSALVPGLGKLYARDRKDAIVSILFVGGLAFQAYRAFHRRGPESLAGWLYAGVGFGFYLGNIYGSVKSARQYNQRYKTQFNNEAKRLSFSDF